VLDGARLRCALTPHFSTQRRSHVCCTAPRAAVRRLCDGAAGNGAAVPPELTTTAHKAGDTPHASLCCAGALRWRHASRAL
jgi:hypothetical protein